jgi:spermidine/putrescine-binding protein
MKRQKKMMRSLKKKAALAAATTLAAVGLMTVIATPASAATVLVSGSGTDYIAAGLNAVAQCPSLDDVTVYQRVYLPSTGLYYVSLFC